MAEGWDEMHECEDSDTCVECAILQTRLRLEGSDDIYPQRSLIYTGYKPLPLNVLTVVNNLEPGDRFDPDDYAEVYRPALMNELEGQNIVLSTSGEVGRIEECPTCEGKGSFLCSTCEDYGWVTRWGHDRLEPYAG